MLVLLARVSLPVNFTLTSGVKELDYSFVSSDTIESQIRGGSSKAFFLGGEGLLDE